MNMEPQFSHSRSMPSRHRDMLRDLRAGNRWYDGRSENSTEALICMNWIVRIQNDEKNPRKALYAITDRGKYALERSDRGVDPYLVMTEAP